MNVERFFQAVLGSACTGLLFFGAGAVVAQDVHAPEPVWFACVIAVFLGFLLGVFVFHMEIPRETTVHAVCLTTMLWFLWGYGGVPPFSILLLVTILFYGAYGMVFRMYPLLRRRWGKSHA
jgi:hypothetical protein